MGLFGSVKQAAPPPPLPPAAMPDQAQLDASKQAAIATQIARQGRQSTILTQSDKMGAGA
jgi:hypothetical protein